MRRIKVLWHKLDEKVLVGELAEAKDRTIYFDWNKDFIKEHLTVELSPLTLKKQINIVKFARSKLEGLHGLFADHVPDGWGRLLMKRGLEKEGVVSDDLSPLDMLQYIGDKGMGALSFEPALRKGEIWADGKVDLNQIESRIEPILMGSASAVLNEFLEGGSSLNGMRPKILLKERKGVFYLGEKEIKDVTEWPANEWLVKFRAPEDSIEAGKIEYIYSLMAKDAGLDVAECKLLKTKKGYLFATKRFDRVMKGDATQRIHMHTVSGILNTESFNFTVSYDDFAKVTSLITKDIREVKKVLRIAAFNVLTCNQDDHAKNVSFLMDANGKWQVAPAYDLTFHQTTYGEHKMRVGGNGKPSLEELEKFGIKFGISKSEVKRVLAEVKDGVAKFLKYAKKFEVRKREVERVKKGLKV